MLELVVILLCPGKSCGLLAEFVKREISRVPHERGVRRRHLFSQFYCLFALLVSVNLDQVEVLNEAPGLKSKIADRKCSEDVDQVDVRGESVG